MRTKLNEKINEWFLKHPWVIGTIAWAKRTSLPGLEGVPVYDVVIFYYKETQRNALNVRARAIAFSFMLAIFPTIIFVFTLIPYLPVKNFDTTLLNFANTVLPQNAYDLLFTTIEDLVKIPRGGLLSLGFILAVWFSTEGVFSMLSAFRKVHKQTFRARSLLEKRWVAVKLTILLFFLLMISIFFIVAGDFILVSVLKIFNAGALSYFASILLKWLVIIFLFYSATSIIYRYGPSMKRESRITSPGATIATILSIITSLGFSLFVNQFGRYNQFYGSIGTLIVAMIWLNLNSLILLIGFELNASIAINRDLKSTQEETENWPVKSDSREL